MKIANPKFTLVVQDFKTAKFNQTELSRRHGVSSSTVSVWLRKSGIKGNSRGRPQFEKPTNRQLEMLRQVQSDTFAVVAERFGVTKQYASKLLQRWQGWAEHKFGPRSISAGKSQEKAEIINIESHTIQPHVISFRVSDQVLSGILDLRRAGQQRRGCSPHFVARSLLTRLVEDKQREATPAAEQSEFNYCI